MNVVFIAAEVNPFSKVGGLADVTGALPKALAKMGIDVKVVTPVYKTVDKEKFNLINTSAKYNVSLGSIREKFKVLKWNSSDKDAPEIYFIDNENFFSSRNIYTDENGLPYPDNTERFVFLQKAALRLIEESKWKVDILHCHDYHTAVIPIYLKTVYSVNEKFKFIKTLLTIHNIAYQGIVSMGKKEIFDLPDSLFYPDGAMEWYGKINPLKGGIIYSDKVSTVSKTYAQEIMNDEEISAGLRDVIRSRNDKVYGIVNGVDYSEWNPETDPFIKANYSLKSLKDKYIDKLDLIREFNLDEEISEKPLIGIVSRLVEQKGVSLIIEAVDKILKIGAGLVILGSGEQKYQNFLKEIAINYPKRIGIYLGYNNSLAHKIIAGSDMFLMPSRYEPCGITNLCSLKYGTVPIVRKTGGLADTIVQWGGGKGTGFLFNEFSPEAMVESISEAVRVFENKAIWAKIMHNGMKEDFSWERSSSKYVNLYEEILKR
jgi:starch synthase